MLVLETWMFQDQQWREGRDGISCWNWETAHEHLQPSTHDLLPQQWARLGQVPKGTPASLGVTQRNTGLLKKPIWLWWAHWIPWTHELMLNQTIGKGENHSVESSLPRQHYPLTYRNATIWRQCLIYATQKWGVGKSRCLKHCLHSLHWLIQTSRIIPHPQSLPLQLFSGKISLDRHPGKRGVALFLSKIHVPKTFFTFCLLTR